MWKMTGSMVAICMLFKIMLHITFCNVPGEETVEFVISE
jgi:hypothetical protein